MTERTSREKKLDIACLILFPLGFAIYTALTLMGIYGKDHEMIYVVVTEIILLGISVVLPLLRVSNKLVTPYWFIAIVEGLIYMHGSALYWGTYIWIPYWDIIAHISASVVVTLVAFIGLMTIKTYTTRIQLGNASLLFMLFIIGYGFGNAWEMLEWSVDSAFSYAYMAYSIEDSLRDIVNDFIGAGTMTLLAALILRNRTPREIIMGFGLDKFMTNMGKRWDRKCADDDIGRQD
ncbi:MAG: hypothetical protein LBM39_03145 [Candidatus Methanoplasma sp.]|jgi:hypothetical protein|nr:hypothetical protein [Candidatus Methanoplasma sp.]